MITINDNNNRILFILIFSTIIYVVYAQDIYDARSISMGSIKSVSENLSSIYNNPSITGCINNSIGVNYYNRYSMKELSDRIIFIKQVFRDNSFGLMFHKYGYDMYSENNVVFGYSKKLSNTLYAGLNMCYNYIKIGDKYYKNYNYLSTSAGLYYNLNKRLYIGTSLLNFSSTGNKYHQKNISLNIGISYMLYDYLKILTEISKNINYKEELKIGIDYNIKKSFHVTYGMIYPDARNSFGFGFDYRTLTFFISSYYHRYLGFSYASSIVYNIKKTK